MKRLMGGRIASWSLVAVASIGCSQDHAGATAADADVDAAVDECTGDVVCVSSFPFTSLATSATWYRLDVPAPGFLAVQLVAGTGNLALATERQATTPLDVGSRVGAMVEAGRYWVAADLAPPFQVRMQLTTVATLTGYGMAAAPARDALHAFGVAWQRHDTRRFEYGITDFSLHSSIKRQWILDLTSDQPLWNLHVAHGEGSTDGVNLGMAIRFSNVPDSHQSSLGLMRSAESYDGTYGHSFRLDGLEPGFNDKVRDRVIVVHPWQGSRPEYVAANGIVDPTFGCPAVDDRLAPTVVDKLANGTLMLYWYPDATWQQQSVYLR